MHFFITGFYNCLPQINTLNQKSRFTFFTPSKMNRKDFLNKLLIGGSLLFLTPFFDPLYNIVSDSLPAPENYFNPVTIDLNSSLYRELKTIGGFVYFENIIILRTSKTQYIVLSKISSYWDSSASYNYSFNKPVSQRIRKTVNADELDFPRIASIPLISYTTTLDGTILTLS